MSLLFICIALFATGSVLSLLRIRRETESLRIAAKACSWTAITAGVALIAWHASARSQWLPLDDNFEALIWLGLILALFVVYVQRRHPIGGLDWFVMPMVILLLIGAAIFGRTSPREYLPTTWSWIHRLFSYGGAVAFVVAGSVGAMYLVANRRLRMKVMTGGPKLGNLERLEEVTLASVTLGFALLTVGAITGFIWFASSHRPISVWKVSTDDHRLAGLRRGAPLANEPEISGQKHGDPEHRGMCVDAGIVGDGSIGERKMRGSSQ